MTRHERGHEQGRDDHPSRDTHDGSRDARDEKHTTERYGPDGPLNDRTGNETVNDGPRNGMDDHGLGGETPRGGGPSGQDTPFGHLPGRDRLLRDVLGPGAAGASGVSVPDASASDGLGEDDLGQDALGEDDLGQDDLGQDELALRRMLRGAVVDLEPSEGALDHLRRAVPARRARKRQALVGLAASVILLGTAVPAFVHVASSGGLDDLPVNAGHGEQAQGGTGEDESDDSGEVWNGDSAGVQPSAPGAPSAAVESPSPGTDSTGDSTGGTTAPTDSAVVSTPACEAGQLGVNSAQAGAPEADGKVYGTFRIANVSGSECSVAAAGAVNFQPRGAADPTKINVVTHITGDAAGGLPDPSEEISAVVLKPEAAYEVKFAFVPSETCPTTGGPSPDPSPSDGGSSGTTDGTAGTTSTEAQLLGEEGEGTADGSIAVTHTPEPGGPNAEATIPNACAGTIYRTGILSAP